MSARSCSGPVSFKLHALALVAIGVLTACSKGSAPNAPAPVAAAPDVASSDAMAPPAMAPAPVAATTTAPAPLPPPAPLAVARGSRSNAPIDINPAAGNEPSYVNESTNAPTYSPNNAPTYAPSYGPSYADDAQYADDDQRQVVSVYVDPPQEEPAPVAVDWAPPPMLVEDVPPPPYPDAVWTGGYWAWQGRWVWSAGRWSRPPREH